MTITRQFKTAWKVLGVGILLWGALGHRSFADESEKHENTHEVHSENIEDNTLCPVLTDEPIDPNVFAEYQGKRVYLCCMRCRKQFLDNPTDYLANLPQFAHLAMGQAEQENEHSSPAHDHVQGHGEAEGISRFIRFAGRFHPVAVHFPIALVFAAALSEIPNLAGLEKKVEKTLAEAVPPVDSPVDSP